MEERKVCFIIYIIVEKIRGGGGVRRSGVKSWGIKSLGIKGWGVKGRGEVVKKSYTLQEVSTN